MATVSFAAVALAGIVTLVQIPVDKKLHLRSGYISNGGAGAHTIYLRDDFTPDASHLVASPIPKTIVKATWVVGAGAVLPLDKDALTGKEFLGTLKGYADGAEALCITTLDYDFDEPGD